MLKTRIIPCLDVDKGRVVKGINFIRLRDDGLLESKGSTIERILKRDITGNRDLHIWDYQLFWGQLRENSQKRVKEFLKNNG